MSQTCFMASNSSPLNFPEFPLDCDLLCDSACCNDSSPSGSACVRVRPLKLIVGKLQCWPFQQQYLNTTSCPLYQSLSPKLCLIWEHSEETMLLTVISACCKPWQGDRVAEAGAGIVMEMSARRSQRSFTQEMDRGTRGQGRPGHANNPCPPKLNVL